MSLALSRVAGDQRPRIVPRVPAEFRGRARLFRQEVAAAADETTAALRAITSPLRARLARHPRLRQEQVAIALAQYRRLVPSQFRIGEVEMLRSKTELAIGEVRLCASTLALPAWGADQREAGVGICRYVLTVRAAGGQSRARLREGWFSLAIVSLHALARWFERSGCRDPAALLADLAVLADAEPDGERVAAGGGGWLGERRTVWEDGRSIRMRSVRTWVATQ